MEYFLLFYCNYGPMKSPQYYNIGASSLLFFVNFKLHYVEV